MKRIAPLLILVLLLTGCAGDDPVVDGGDIATTTGVTPAAGASTAGDTLRAPFDEARLDGLDREVLLDLQRCAEDDADACTRAAAALSDDQVSLIVDLCTSDVEEYCTVLETLYADTEPVSEGPTGYAEALDNLDPDGATPDGSVVMNADGAEVDGAVLSFGEDPDAVIDAITDAVGPPSQDTGYRSAVEGAGCAGQEYRAVTWREMTITILDLSRFATGAPHFAAWQTVGPSIPAQAFVGDSTLVPLNVGATTLGQLQDTIPSEDLAVAEDDQLGVGFTIEDNLGALSGELSTSDAGGVVLAVSAGDGCRG